MATSTFKLLYVCNGNNARSPLAAAATKAILAGTGASSGEPKWDIDSAGTETRDGDAIRPEARAAAGSLDLDISGHRPRVLTSEECLAPDLILAMSWEQVSFIWSAVPEAWEKVFTIKEFVHWAKRAPVRPPILFEGEIDRMRDKIVQAHAVRKRARADYGFWGGIRPQDLNLIEPNGKGEQAWTTLANAVHALASDVITLMRGPERPADPSDGLRVHTARARPKPKTRAKARR